MNGAYYDYKLNVNGQLINYGHAPQDYSTDVIGQRLRDWLDLEARLRHAVEDDRLQLRFQPKFRLSDNRIAGVEALLRWCDSEYGEISPNRFVEIAEDSGLIIEMGSWVARTACQTLTTPPIRRRAANAAAVANSFLCFEANLRSR